MKSRKYFLAFIAACVAFLITGCNAKTIPDSGITGDHEMATNESKDISAEIPYNKPPETDEEKWRAAVGEWEDQAFRGYTMQVSQNEAETDMLFSISFTPYGGMFLDWALPCKLLVEDEALHYDKGVMTYLEIVSDESGNPQTDSSVDKNLVGSFSFDSDQDVLCWYNGLEENSEPIYFVRSQNPENEPSEMMINGIPYAVAAADGWGDAWQTVAEIIRNDTDIYFKEAEEDSSLYGSGNAWDDFTIEGITYEMAAKHGWGDTWWEVIDHFGSDYDAYSGSESYDDFSEQGNNSSGELSNAKLTEINSQISSSLAIQWKNFYNQSASRDFRISNVQARTIFPKIKRNGLTATVTTEISYWFINQGGSPAGSVYSVVIIDASNGNVLSADVTD